MAKKKLFLLYEYAAGLSLFERVENEEIALELESAEKSMLNLQTFSKSVRLHAFSPFPNMDVAFENVKLISEGVCSDYVKKFLNANLPKIKKHKKTKFELGVVDVKLASSVQEALKVSCISSDIVRELLRGVRTHFSHFVKGLTLSEMESAELGLSHKFSQHKVKFSLKREDNMVIQSISILDSVDKDLNSLFMRINEWYSWHFPELKSLINDGATFVRVVNVLHSRESLKHNKKTAKKKLKKILGCRDKVRLLIKAADRSIGFEISPIDMSNLALLSQRCLSLLSYREELFTYLQSKMNNCAPNLSALVGETVGARLISHAGGLGNLSKCPASTVQVLGAEKALFRALKTRSATPKYGLLFHSPFITKAKQRNKGKISRFLANKCSLASRIDSFSDKPGSEYGRMLHEQVSERQSILEASDERFSGAVKRKTRKPQN